MPQGKVDIIARQRDIASQFYTEIMGGIGGIQFKIYIVAPNVCNQIEFIGYQTVFKIKAAEISGLEKYSNVASYLVFSSF